MNEKIKNIKTKFPIKVNKYAIIVGVLLLIIIISLSARRTYNEVFDKYIEASMNFDAGAMVDLLHESYIDTKIERGLITDKSTLIHNQQYTYDCFQKKVESLCEETGGKYEYEITLIEDCKMTEGDFYRLSILLGENAKKVKAAKRVIIDFNVRSGEQVIPIYTDHYFFFIKIGQNWYLGEMPQSSN